jgi:hypothetical protein
MMKRAKWLIAAATAMAVTGPSAAYNQWGSYHWATDGNGLTLTVERQITPVWGQFFNNSVSDWNASNKLNLTGAGANLGVSSKKCNPLSGKALVCNDSYGFRGWLGIATIWANGDHITQATTKLNDSYFNTSTYNHDDWRMLVACQEIGHDFGLDHQDETFDNYNLGTCMDYTNAPSGGVVGGFNYGPANLHPNSGDYDTLTYMYSHNDTTGGGGGGGGHGRPADAGPQAADAFTFREVGKPTPGASAVVSPDWGRAIAFDASGRPDTFQLDLGDGHRKITHVFWVPGHRPVPENMRD